MSWFARAFSKLRDDFAALRKGEPGRRFVEHYERHRRSEKKSEGAWKTAAYVLLGLALLLAGLLLSLPPGVPDFLLWVPGLGLLVARLRPFAVFIDRVELFLRGVWKKMTVS